MPFLWLPILSFMLALTISTSIFHFICELVACGALRLRHVSTNFQLVNIFTKGLSCERFQLLYFQVQLRDLPLQLQGSIKE
ncbi:hypothetical protein Pint_22777 [Pistacia integerrima]|uniref:Uncharacterized protein n=1 Tax=Pistacia integerrima TaxID=434235 RepID=A0ACC0YLY7_9ROSI|nr:hypothetical protein Pint_22777 [Pistacia integerrima]